MDINNKIHIKAIGKFNFSFFNEKFQHKGALHLSQIFWVQVFSEYYLKHFKKKSDNISRLLSKASYAQSICRKFSCRPIDAIELFFIYQFFFHILESLNTILQIWKIDLARGITSAGNNYISENLDESILKSTEGNYLYQTLVQVYQKQNFTNIDTVVFDIFWPSEIAQGIFTAKILKEKYSHITFILNTENGNEQFDFFSYIQSLVTEQYALFTEIDFINTNKGALDVFLQAGKDGNPHEVYNLFVNTGAEFVFKSSMIIQDTIEKSFDKNLQKTAILEDHIFGKKYVNLRLYPYKCYHSACFFCTINNGNDAQFPHKDLSVAKQYVDKVLAFIHENSIENVNFFDEAIHPNILEYFVEKILSGNYVFNYRFRARYLPIFLKESFIEKLYDSGARYVGVGLETASSRINNMVNKSNGDLNIEEKYQVIKNFNKFKISFHNYSIFGFPQETQEESLLTFKFLCNAIEKMDYFTCTPNIFGLMKGSFIYSHPKKFGIDILGDGKAPVSDFLVNGKRRDYRFLNALTGKVNERQFTKYMPQIPANDFWDFIDRSGIFYHFKVLYNKNPYIYHFNIVNGLLSQKRKKLFGSIFRKTEFYIISQKQEDVYVLQSLLSEKIITCSKNE